MPVSKRRRFEVFKRDKFTCQYCGNRVPDVVLHFSFFLVVFVVFTLYMVVSSSLRLDRHDTEIERMEFQIERLQARTGMVR